MNYTLQFRTKTMNIQRQNPRSNKYWGIAIDAGYSSIKGMSPNKIYCFPSYAKRIESEEYFIGKADKNRILYKDGNTGEIWVVGAMAQNMIQLKDTDDSIATLYGRNRYFSTMFKVITRTGIACGLKPNSYGQKPDYMPIMIQTGLPSAYKGDAADLRESLSGHHDFYLKFADEPWEHYEYDINPSNVFIMPQPMGTFQSICTNKDGCKIYDATKYIKSNMLIFDPGFGTLDTINIQNQVLEGDGETFPELSMKRVLSLVSDRIYNDYGTRIPVPAMQKYLETGEFVIRNRKEMKTSKLDFSDILAECNKEICMKAIEQIKSVYDDLFEHDYLVITGGTGEAWAKMIREHFSGMETLTVIDGNQNDTSLPFIFSNVRGYYMSLLDTIKMMARAEKK